jgi:hypothetical protein
VIKKLKVKMRLSESQPKCGVEKMSDAGILSSSLLFYIPLHSRIRIRYILYGNTAQQIIFISLRKFEYEESRRRGTKKHF